MSAIQRSAPVGSKAANPRSCWWLCTVRARAAFKPCRTSTASGSCARARMSVATLVSLYTRIGETTGDRLAGERYNVAHLPCPISRYLLLCHKILCIWTRPDSPSILRCGSSVAAQRVHKPRSGRVRSNMTRPHADNTVDRGQAGGQHPTAQCVFLEWALHF
jgi:hypothetical protein